MRAACASRTFLAGFVVTLLFAVPVASIPSVQSGNPDAILGKWLSQQKNVGIEIYRHNGKYAGKIAWFREPNYRLTDTRGMGGKPRIDRENPDPAKRNRPLMGINLMWDFVFTGNDLWDNGFMYDPVHGNTYRGQIRLDGPDTLMARGFVLFALFGRTEILTRTREWPRLKMPVPATAKTEVAPAGNGVAAPKPANKSPQTTPKTPDGG